MNKNVFIKHILYDQIVYTELNYKLQHVREVGTPTWSYHPQTGTDN